MNSNSLSKDNDVFNRLKKQFGSLSPVEQAAVARRRLWKRHPAEFTPAEPTAPRTRWFNVLIGSRKIRSRILERGEKITPEQEAAGCYSIDVPEEYRRDFEFNLEESIRGLAGICVPTYTPGIDELKVPELPWPKLQAGNEEIDQAYKKLQKAATAYRDAEILYEAARKKYLAVNDN